MRRAGRLHAVHWGTGLLLVLLLAFGAERTVSYVRLQNLSERLQTAVAHGSNSRGPDVPSVIEDLNEFPPHKVLALLNHEFGSPNNGSRQKLAIAYAKASLHASNASFCWKRQPRRPMRKSTNLVTALGQEMSRRRGYPESSCGRHVSAELGIEDAVGHGGIVSQRCDDRGGNAAGRAACQAEGQLDVEAHPDWNDAPLHPDGLPVADTTRAEMAAHGLLEERFAFCLDMPWEHLDDPGDLATQPLSAHSRVRLCTTACGRWRRCGRARCSAVSAGIRSAGRTIALLRATPPPCVMLVPADVAAYPAESECDPLLRAVVSTCIGRRTTSYGHWYGEGAIGSDRRAGKGGQATGADTAGIYFEGWHATILRDLVQTGRICLRKCRGDRGPTGSGEVAPVVWDDISVAFWLPTRWNCMPTTGKDRVTAPGPTGHAGESPVRRGKARYYLDQPQDALVDLDALAVQSPPNTEALLYGALCRGAAGYRGRSVRDTGKAG